MNNFAKVNLQKWWGKKDRFRRRAMVSCERMHRAVNFVINKIGIVFPVSLTALIVVIHIIFAPVYGFGVEVIRNLILMLAGVWAFYGIIVAARRTAAFEKQIEIQERGQMAERIAKAAEQLSSEVMPVRILAILSLGKIALEVDKQTCQDIIKVLCAYIREKRPKKEEDSNSELPPEEDIYKIIKILSEIQEKKPDYSRGCIDLSNTNLSGVYVRNANLSGANLSGADLLGANLSRAFVIGANLSDADLSDADLSGANLSGADLSDADLSDADLSGANLSGADLSDANLSGANLSGADLSGANLSGANLSDADLSDADLSDADLSDANLSDADLSDADLSDADLSDAYLSDIEGLDTAKNLETVKNPPPEIIAEFKRREQSKQA